MLVKVSMGDWAAAVAITTRMVVNSSPKLPSVACCVDRKAIALLITPVWSGAAGDGMDWGAAADPGEYSKNNVPVNVTQAIARTAAVRQNLCFIAPPTVRFDISILGNLRTYR
jgi:hypothetical protein